MNPVTEMSAISSTPIQIQNLPFTEVAPSQIMAIEIMNPKIVLRTTPDAHSSVPKMAINNQMMMAIPMPTNSGDVA